jgi:hypothetical protein
MMGISRITAYVIASNEVKTYAVGPVEGKWQGVIAHGENHEHHPGMMIVSSEYYFDSKEAAETAMNETVSQIRQAVAGEGTAT